MLKIRYKHPLKDPFWIMERAYAIGQASDNHLVLDDPDIAPHHAKIFRDGDNYHLRDLGTDSGSYINNQRITSKQISYGDHIRLGSVELEIVDPVAETQTDISQYWALIADSSWLTGQEFPLIFDKSSRLSIGRGKQCDIVFPGTHLSREHATLSLQGDLLILEDCKSANGTFVNDERISRAEVVAGDRIRLDVYSFRIFGPGIKLPNGSSKHPKVAPTAEALPSHNASAEIAARSHNNGSDVKRWKTRPTSPGNRPGEEPVDSSGKNRLAVAVATAILLVLAAVTAKVLGLI